MSDSNEVRNVVKDWPLIKNAVKKLSKSKNEEDKALFYYLGQLEIVAGTAAYCCIDLNNNLEAVEKEFMDGDISAGARRHVENRHASMIINLAKAGFTEKHKLYEFPIRPEENNEA